jgi:hypothetical protein
MSDGTDSDYERSAPNKRGSRNRDRNGKRRRRKSSDEDEDENDEHKLDGHGKGAIAKGDRKAGDEERTESHIVFATACTTGPASVVGTDLQATELRNLLISRGMKVVRCSFWLLSPDL